MDGCNGRHTVHGRGANIYTSGDAAWENREIDGVWGDGQNMSKERCLELRQRYTGQTDVEREMEGEKVSAQLQAMA